MESSVKNISRPVIDRLPVDVNQLDEFACRQLDRVCLHNSSSPHLPFPPSSSKSIAVPPLPTTTCQSMARALDPRTPNHHHLSQKWRPTTTTPCSTPPVMVPSHLILPRSSLTYNSVTPSSKLIIRTFSHTNPTISGPKSFRSGFQSPSHTAQPLAICPP